MGIFDLFSSKVTCPTCNGTGKEEYSSHLESGSFETITITCSKCNGSGKIPAQSQSSNQNNK